MIYPIWLSDLYRAHKEEYMEAFSEFFDAGVFIGGPAVREFEKNIAAYLGAAEAVGCGNGTQALELALKAHGIGRGDEVITTANTYYATARAIVNTGADAVFCDVDENGLLDPDLLEALITERTRAVLPVHLYGLCADLDAIREICGRHGIVCVEDCAHALGSESGGEKIGSRSRCACFSLYPTKNLGAFGDAGFIATDDPELAAKMRRLRYYTSDPERLEFQTDGMHTRLDPLHASLLNVSLRHVDEWNAVRRRHRAYYVRRFQGAVPYLKKMEEPGVVPYVFPIVADDQKAFSDHLQSRGIVPQIHYRPDLHRIGHLLPGGKPCAAGSLPRTEYLNAHVVSIPVSPTVTDEEAEQVADAVLDYWRGR